MKEVKKNSSIFMRFHLFSSSPFFSGREQIRFRGVGPSFFSAPNVLCDIAVEDIVLVPELVPEEPQGP